jgi:spermidine synthase
VCQLLITGAIGWTAWTISNSMPFWPIDPGLDETQWFTFQLDMARTIWAILPAACLWGASFPLALAAAAAPGQEPGRLVGGLYAVNTVGAILGATLFSMWLIPVLGTADAQRLLIILAFVASMAAWLSVAFAPAGAAGTASAGRAGGPMQWDAGQVIGWLGGAIAATILVAVLVTKVVEPIPWGLAAYGRYMATYDDLGLEDGVISEDEVALKTGPAQKYCIFLGEGMNVTVAVTKDKWGIRSFHGGGKVQASSDPADMKLQRMLGHIPALAFRNPETGEGPKSVLVVACGAGVTAGSFVPHPEVEEIVIVDIERLVPEKVAPLFANENFDVVGTKHMRGRYNPNVKVEVVIDDGRHYIRTANRKFDIITSDPIDPWVKGCAALNTKEYYEMCKAHLNPGGVMALWMPIYESNEESLKSVISTFFEVFPKGILWTNDVNNEGYDAVLFGQAEGTVINLDEMEERLNRQPTVRQSMRDVGFNSIYELFGTYAGEAGRMAGWREGAQINTDKNLRLQYLAGLALNNYKGKELLDGILQYYSFPEEVFEGSPEKIEQLKQVLSARGRHDRD